MNQCNKKISCDCKRFLLYSKRDLNPHSHHWPKDFKSFVSTDSTIRAALKRGTEGCITRKCAAKV